jgi:prophage regulatory protein
MSIMRMPAVKAETGHRSHASIYNAIREGLFTKPVRIGARAVGWPSGEVQAIVAARIAGKSPIQIRALVSQLETARKGLS